ncbi:MAG: M3 family oligoendopeptidase [Gemmatimonadetes bacterium]|nr:M3 family oligoendopeptidase [Gemmatimonadota bacterium]
MSIVHPPPPPHLRFVPPTLDPADGEALARLYDALEARGVGTREELEALVLDWDELESAVHDARALAYADMTGDTTCPDFAARYRDVVERALPVAEERGFRLKRKVLASPAAGELGSEYAVFLRDLRAEVGLFREENVPLLTEDLRLAHEFEKVIGGQSVELRGERLTLPWLLPLLDEPDRALREEAWRARAAVLQGDAERLDATYDAMLDVRARIASGAGLPDYREYRFRELRRFDYTPADCFALHDAIERHVVPVVVADQERRRRALGLETMRPWDLTADAAGRGSLRLFDTADRLREGCGRILRRLDPELGALFHGLAERGLLDLDSRPGKTSTGYMAPFLLRRLCMIFMSAVGTRRNVETLLHESGHALNLLLARDQPLGSYRFPPVEFAEVGSMAMELLARPFMGEFCQGEELERILDDHLIEALALLPRTAMIDAFQHWVYTTPGCDAAARRAKWIELDERFRPGVDWSGLEEARGNGWQLYHVFALPFYMVEYSIAQLAALRIWLRSLEDPRGALDDYKRALALGGSRPLPELFRAAGVELTFDEGMVARVVEATTARIGALA